MALPSWVCRKPLPTASQNLPPLEPRNYRAQSGPQSFNYSQPNETMNLTAGEFARRPPIRGTRTNPSTSKQQQKRPLRDAPSSAVIPPGWENRRSILVVLRELPQWTTPLDISRNFSQYGNIAYIEVDEERRNGSRIARFRFEPPPKDISFFHEGQCQVVIRGRECRVRIEFAKPSFEDGTSTTPLGNPCPGVAALRPPKLRFGILTQPNTFLEMNTVQPLRPELPLKLDVDFKKKKLIIEFPVRFQTTRYATPLAIDRLYRVHIKFGAIKDICKVDIPNRRNDQRCGLVVTVEDPPWIWKKKADVNKTFQEGRMSWYENDMWQRAVDISGDSRSAKEPVSLADDAQVINLGRWTTYWFDVDQSTMALWTAVEANLRDWNVKIKHATFREPARGGKAEVWAMLDDELPAREGAWVEHLASLGDDRPHTSLRFDVRYQLEVCISHGIINEYNIERDFIEKLIELSKPENLDPDRGRLVLEYAADQGKRIYNPMELFANPAAMTYYPTTMIIPDYCALIRKVTVTPTRIYFNTPTVETTNRIIRHFKHVKDNFIRLQFTDELMEGRINGCEADRDDLVYARAFRVLNHGIRMGQWHWKFLAFGNSQIRENGAFFFCEPEGDGSGDAVTCDKIMQWMGQFSHIKVVAKYAARIGQCFSTTRLVPGISAPRLIKIPDVERGKYCFTDGVGKISPLLAQMVAKDWQLDVAPSAYQFRMGGCKGVLVSWPDVKGTEVHIRKSQEKFFAVFNGLEVIRCSQFSCATLNRQTITILSCLGVPDHVFVDMMAEQVADYNEAMTNKYKAIELLEQFVDENQITITIAQMILSGFVDSSEPFVQTVLQLWRSWSIKSLKEKARVTVKQGAFVLGCVDETGTLQGHSSEMEGQIDIDISKLPQVFLQVPDPEDHGVYKVIKGLCIVGRNPSLHPGDIRVVNAVDVPALRHIRDVVVFPLTGDKDIPSMCSGGDLDGDDFFVIWDHRLIPQVQEWCHAPMDYTAPEPFREENGPSIDSLKAFFVLYMKNNNLPLIAHAHLATADYEDEGAKHENCKRLAALHSTAVDYVKTGVPAEWSKKLEPRRWPHFMEKARRNTYHSNEALGQLYDMVNRETWDSKDNFKLPFDARILNKFHLSNDLLKKARRIKTKYDIAIRRVMGQLEINTEFEVWSTFVLSRPRVGTPYKLQEKVGRESAALKQQYRDECVREAGGLREFDKFAPFVAAMYRVTWEEMQIALHEARQPHVRPDGSVGKRRITARSMPLISFPWLFESVLARIATGGDPTTRIKYSHLKHHANPASKPTKPHGHTVSIMDDQPEELGMDYTRTDDGQVIHRGEILHLFRHDDEDEDREDDEIHFGDDNGGGGPGRASNMLSSLSSEDEVNPIPAAPAPQQRDSNGVWSLNSGLSESPPPKKDSCLGEGDPADKPTVLDDKGEAVDAAVVSEPSTPKRGPVPVGQGGVEEEIELISLYTPSSSPKKETVAIKLDEANVESVGGVGAHQSLQDVFGNVDDLCKDLQSLVVNVRLDATLPMIVVEEQIDDSETEMPTPFSVASHINSNVVQDAAPAKEQEEQEEDPSALIVLELEDVIFSAPGSPPVLEPTRAVADSVGVSDENASLDNDDESLSEPEYGYEEVVLDAIDESIMERYARLEG